MPNRLANESSLYLRQHGEQPVDWYPWGEEALKLAKELNKPILLSIGYSACHWCHVMAHECFDNESIAKLMNANFINIKVDREERPDLDQIYQTAHYMLTERSGGWPLTIFLTPDQVPFFAGTYYPAEPRYGMPSFSSVLENVTEYFKDHADEVSQRTAKILTNFESLTPESVPEGLKLSDEILSTAYRNLTRQFDRHYGGFGAAPKFPHPVELRFCLRYFAHKKARDAMHILNLSMRKMSEGGIYDHIGGGFFRYSVDDFWMIPHFEKMLYDNALLLALYTDCWRVMQDPIHAQVITETATWLLREMKSPEGGFYSSIDADSEGHEGLFYVWNPEQIKEIIPEDEYKLFAPVYGLEKKPNFEDRYWHLYVDREPDRLADELDIPIAKVEAILNNAKRRLFDEREKRVKPHRDEKILVSWNGLAIKGLARAGRALKREDWLDSAFNCIDFIRGKLWNAETRKLSSCYHNGDSKPYAFLDDYANLLDGLIEVIQARLHPQDVQFAIDIADALLEHFEDKENGGFFFTAHDHENLIYREKPSHDHAIPAGNGTAVSALIRLGYLIGEERYITAAERTVRCFYTMITDQPTGHCSLMNALEEVTSNMRVIMIRGNPVEINKWRAAIGQFYHPLTLTLGIPEDTDMSLFPANLNKPMVDGKTTAWVCRGTQCSAPETDLEAFKKAYHLTEADS